MPQFEFIDLTPDVIINALESIDIYPESGLLALNSYENRVYQFIDDNGRRWVVKFYRPARWNDEQIIEEHEFSQDLIDNEIPVVAPEKINEQTLHHYSGYRFTLFPSVGGRQFEVDDFDQIEQVGRYLGRLHLVGKSEPFKHRPAFNTKQFLHDPAEFLQQSELIPKHLHDAFFITLSHVIEQAAGQFTPTSFIRLHGDCHPSNILWRDGPSIVDLDDCRSGPAVQDLWMMLSGDRQHQLSQLDTILEAYEEFNSFDQTQLALIEPLRAMRMVHYMAWLARRWQDPAFPRAFPWFATDKYWEQQILALKEQLSALQEAPLSLTPMY